MSNKALPYFEDLLKDKLCRDSYRTDRDNVSKVLNEFYDFSIEAYGHCVDRAAKCEKPINNTLLALARHNLVYMDCIKTLLANGIVEGCEPQLRSMLECFLGLAHILKENSDNRALSYRYYRLKEIIRKFKMGDKKHEAGKRIEELLKDDIYSPKIMDLLAHKEYAKKADEIEYVLSNEPGFASCEAEWNRLSIVPGKTKKRSFEWYNMFGSATNLRELAEKMNCFSMYMLYKDLCNPTRAGNALDNLAVNGQLRPIRHPENFGQVASLCFSLLGMTIEKLSAFYDTSLKVNYERYSAGVLYPKLEKAIKKIGIATAES